MNYLAINIRGTRSAEKPLWISKLVKENRISFLCMQETQVSNVDEITIGRFWGKPDMECETVDSRGRSGGLVSVWDPGVFTKQDVIKHDSFLLVGGVIAGSRERINVVNVYAPCDVIRRRTLWNELKELKDNNTSGLWIMIGDFNEVRSEEERMMSRFDSQSALIFNRFIGELGLVEYQMGGYKYTYMSEDGKNLSKIDRTLVCDAFMEKWPEARFEALGRHLSDHCPIALCCAKVDFGPIPFRFYNSWLEDEGIDEVVKKNTVGQESENNNMKKLANILKKLKIDLKEWRKKVKTREEKEIKETEIEVESIEKIAEERILTTQEKERRVKGRWKIKITRGKDYKILNKKQS
ncbi:uncharacterized protein LOC118491295 [Helianthus annuus]|uniref:uncharacterized protein LOC118491295 n=1 Tax=Helianthus annuus TaxID=4232 RepID=UPI001652D39B|nr:uncharacterized protein LOC118491295 [Helianthus annuus]